MKETETEIEIEIGLLARLNSGGPLMTVHAVEENEDGMQVTVCWFDDSNKINYCTFSAPCLEFQTL